MSFNKEVFTGQIWKSKSGGDIITIKDRVPKFKNDSDDFSVWYVDVDSDYYPRHEEAMPDDLILENFDLIQNPKKTMSNTNKTNKTASIEEKFIKENLERQNKISQIANALKSSALEPKNIDTKLEDGSVQQVTQTINPFGKELFVVSNNNKNTVTFSTKQQVIDYLKEN